MSILQHNETTKTNIQVMVRIKPGGSAPPLVWSPIRVTVTEDGKRKDFIYDYVFNPDTTNAGVFAKVGEPVIANAFAGYNTCVFAYGQSGCFAPGTPIMLYDGRYKNVENITLNDVLMGDDSTPRRVSKLYSGYEPMYTVIPQAEGFDSYTVNYSHTLVCKVYGRIKEIPLSKYLYNGYSYPVVTCVPEFKTASVTLNTPATISALAAVLNAPIVQRREYLLNIFPPPVTCESSATFDMDVASLVVQLGRSLGYTTHISAYNAEHTVTLGDQCAEFTPVIKYRGVSRYYGFKLDKNGRFIGAGYNLLRNSGKTHTMIGDQFESASPGLIPRIAAALFDRQSTNNGLDVRGAKIRYKLQLSYLEIYSEEVKDLLGARSERLAVRLDPKTGPFVESLTKVPVGSFAELMRHITEGNSRRTVASTMLNDLSSRSHAIVTIYFTQLIDEPSAGKIREVMSKINLVDLAGSERVGESGVTGINFKEATIINKSLSTLGRVISTLSDKFKSRIPSIAGLPGGPQAPGSDVPVPFRDSKLTFILKESLAGNSKTYLIATITPDPAFTSETISTLRFASNAKQIINRVRVNEDPDDQKILTYNAELKRIRQSMIATKSPADLTRLSLEVQFREELLRADKTWEQKMAETVRLNAATAEAMQRQINELQQAFTAAGTPCNPQKPEAAPCNPQKTEAAPCNPQKPEEAPSSLPAAENTPTEPAALNLAAAHVEIQNQRKLFAGERLVLTSQIQRLTAKCAALEAELTAIKHINDTKI
jgi:hypothetical protein